MKKMKNPYENGKKSVFFEIPYVNSVWCQKSVFARINPYVWQHCFRFLWGAACSVHTAHEEGNSSGLPHSDLPTTNGSDRSSHSGVWLSLLYCLHYPRRECRGAACLCLKCIPGFRVSHDIVHPDLPSCARGTKCGARCWYRRVSHIGILHQ